MSTVTVSTTANGGGLSASFTQTVNPNVVATLNPVKAAAKTGSLAVRTNNNTGTLTMDAGHGFNTGDRLDVFWLDPTTGAQKCQYKVTAGTVATNSVPISAGVGDNLPAALSAVTVQVAVPLDFPLTTTELVALAVGGAAPGKVVLEKADGTVVYNVTLGANGVGSAWVSGFGAANPVSDTVAKAYVTNASSSAANQVNVIAGLTG